MKTSAWVIVIACVVTLFAHYFLYAESRIKNLEQVNLLADKALKIERDTIRDLMHSQQQLAAEKQAIATRSFVSGVLDTMERPDHYNAIWHAGYDRGNEVKDMMLEVDSKVDSNFTPKDKLFGGDAD